MAYLGRYTSPQELMLDKSVSREEKIQMLEQWRDDKKALLRASGEGMQGSDRPDVLKEIKKALILLREGSA